MIYLVIGLKYGSISSSFPGPKRPDHQTSQFKSKHISSITHQPYPIPSHRQPQPLIPPLHSLHPLQPPHIPLQSPILPQRLQRIPHQHRPLQPRQNGKIRNRQSPQRHIPALRLGQMSIQHRPQPLHFPLIPSDDALTGLFAMSLFMEEHEPG